MEETTQEYVPVDAKVCGRCDEVHPLGKCKTDEWTEEDERKMREAARVRLGHYQIVYKCGCVASGPTPLPDYCPEHEPSKPSSTLQNVLRSFPSDPEERKQIPITTGVLDYFPLAVAEIARVSKAGNDQHNPGQPLHWARGKSVDHADCITRHLIQRGTVDSDGQRHTAKMAWRALALLQEELEAEAGFTV